MSRRRFASDRDAARPAERVPEREAVVAGAERLAYSELLDRSLRLARALQDLGVARGVRVAIYMDNSAGCATAIYAAMLAGGVFVVVNPQTKEDKLLYVLDDCEAAVVLTEGSLTRTALAAAAAAPSVKAVIAASLPDGVEGALGFEDVVASAQPEPRAAGTSGRAWRRSSNVGGAGFPKGVMMTHQSMVFARGASRSTALGHREPDLGLLPLAFEYGLYSCSWTVLRAARSSSNAHFAFPAQIVKARQEEEATFSGVPRSTRTLLSMRRTMDSSSSVRRVERTRPRRSRRLSRGDGSDLPERARVRHVRADRVQARELPRAGAHGGEADVRRQGDPGHRDDGAPRGRDAGRAGRDRRALRARAARHGRLLAEARADR